MPSPKELELEIMMSMTSQMHRPEEDDTFELELEDFDVIGNIVLLFHGENEFSAFQRGN